jgi:protein phosphatase
VTPQAATLPEIRSGAHSAKGLRKENQDAMTRFQSRFGDVILVADGMGGHQGGATASGMVAQRFAYHLEAAPPDATLEEALQQATTRVNDEIYEQGHSGDPAIAGMGSTVVVAVIRTSPAGRDVVIANAGDSRAYLVRDGVLTQITKDHTVAQRMVDAGMLNEENARSHPHASVLTRALGQQLGTTAETYPAILLQPGDGLLLCSDGLSGYVTDDKIAPIAAAAADPAGIVQTLIDLALNSGSDDNITVQFVRVADRPPLAQIAEPAPKARPPAKQRWLVIAAIIAAVLIGAPLGWLAWQKIAVGAAKRGAVRTIPSKEPASAAGTQEREPPSTPVAPPAVQQGAPSHEAPAVAPKPGAPTGGEVTQPPSRQPRQQQLQKDKKNTVELRSPGPHALMPLAAS